MCKKPKHISSCHCVKQFPLNQLVFRDLQFVTPSKDKLIYSIVKKSTMKCNSQFMGSAVWGGGEVDKGSCWGLGITQRGQRAPSSPLLTLPPSPFSKCTAPVKIPACYLQARSLWKGMAGSQAAFQRSCRQGRGGSELNYKFLQSSQEAGSPDCGCSVLPRTPCLPRADARCRHPRSRSGAARAGGCFPQTAWWSHMWFSGTAYRDVRCVSRVF